MARPRAPGVRPVGARRRRAQPDNVRLHRREEMMSDHQPPDMVYLVYMVDLLSPPAGREPENERLAGEQENRRGEGKNGHAVRGFNIVHGGVLSSIQP